MARTRNGWCGGGYNSRHAQAPRALSAAVGPRAFPKLLRGHARAVGGEAPRPARLPLQRRHRRRRGRVAVLLRLRGGLRRYGGLRGGDGIPRRSGSACGCPELRYRRRRRAELRTPRQLSDGSEAIARPCAPASADRAGDQRDDSLRIRLQDSRRPSAGRLIRFPQSDTAVPSKDRRCRGYARSVPESREDLEMPRLVVPYVANGFKTPANYDLFLFDDRLVALKVPGAMRDAVKDERNRNAVGEQNRENAGQRQRTQTEQRVAAT